MAAKYTRPFLKWAGGKYRLLDRIYTHLPKGKRLIEPFVGAGSVFLNSGFDHCVINDTNPDLIHLYKTLQKHGPKAINKFKSYFTLENNCAEHFYAFRDRFNKCGMTLERAALFLYLNRHGYNGLCRYNNDGQYNVPFGQHRKPYFPEKELQYYCQLDIKIDFHCGDFAKAFALAKKGDVIYCDPPYVPLSDSANFTQYHQQAFTADDQKQLAQLAKQATKKGITVLISNHHTPFTEEIYQGAHMDVFKVNRSISCKGDERHDACEVLVVFS